MPSLNDLILTATGGPTVNDGLANVWFNKQADETLNDAEHRWLSGLVPVPSTINDMWMQYLRGAGYEGSLNDMLYQYWFDVIDSGPFYTGSFITEGQNDNLVVTFSENIVSPTSSYALGFTIRINNIVQVISGAVRGPLSDQTIIFTLPVQILATDTVTVEYDDTTGDIEDLDSVPLPTFAQQTAQNNSARYNPLEDSPLWELLGASDASTWIVDIEEFFVGATDATPSAVGLVGSSFTDGVCSCVAQTEVADTSAESYVLTTRMTDASNFIGVRSYNGNWELTEVVAGVPNVLDSAPNIGVVPTNISLSVTADFVSVKIGTTVSLGGTTAILTAGQVGIVSGVDTRTHPVLVASVYGWTS